MVDRNQFYLMTPAIRRPKRKPAPVQPLPALHMRINGRWETFTSKAELLAFMANRRGQ